MRGQSGEDLVDDDAVAIAGAKFADADEGRMVLLSPGGFRGSGFVGGQGYVLVMAPTTVADASDGGAIEADANGVTEELAAVLARFGELTDCAAAIAADPTDATLGDRHADAARIDQIALLDRIQAAPARRAAGHRGPPA